MSITKKFEGTLCWYHRIIMLLITPRSVNLHKKIKANAKIYLFSFHCSVFICCD